jgi:hypothetical protein
MSHHQLVYQQNINESFAWTCEKINYLRLTQFYFGNVLNQPSDLLTRFGYLTATKNFIVRLMETDFSLSPRPA